MASGHRKRKAALTRLYTLNPAGLTNQSTADIGNSTNQDNIVNIANYSGQGYVPSFSAGAAGLLSDAVSNADGAWTSAGLTGETTNAGAYVTSSLTATGLTAAGKHYFFPAVGGTQTNLSSSGAPNSPIIIYTIDGPQSDYVPYYLGGTTATGSVKLGSAITGAGAPTHLVVYVGGQLTTGDQIRLLNAAGTTVLSASGASPVFALGAALATASAAELVSNSGKKVMLIPTGSVLSGLIVEFSSSAKTSTTPVNGAFVVISSGSY